MRDHRLRAGPLLAVMATLAVPAGAAEADRFVAGLQAWLDDTRHLEARFEQELLSGALGAGIVESGNLYLERPGRMRWDYLDPESKTALLAGSRMELYLPEDEQLIRSSVPDDGDLLPRLLAGTGRIAELFEADLLETEDGGAPRLRLRPRAGGESFEEVILTLRPRSYEIRGAEVMDAAGNRIAYRFRGLRRNRSLPDGIFRLEPAPGTEIVGEEP